jgi:hypothetical protein
MKPHEETWSLVGCSNPAHGPGMTCWKVKNAHGQVMLRGVDKATAERYAAIPAMARALLMRRKCTEPEGQCQQCSAAAERALKEAGVLE